MFSVVSVICVDITYDSTYIYIESVNQGEHDNRNETCKFTDQIETSTSHPSRWAKAFELLKTGSFKFQPPRAKMVFKCPTL